jgi:hypothetical protein
VQVGLLAVETSTGDIQYGICSTGLVQSQLEAALLAVAPVEVLAVGPLSQQVRAGGGGRRRLGMAVMHCPPCAAAAHRLRS